MLPIFVKRNEIMLRLDLQLNLCSIECVFTWEKLAGSKTQRIFERKYKVTIDTPSALPLLTLPRLTPLPHTCVKQQLRFRVSFKKTDKLLSWKDFKKIKILNFLKQSTEFSCWCDFNCQKLVVLSQIATNNCVQVKSLLQFWQSSEIKNLPQNLNCVLRKLKVLF